MNGERPEGGRTKDAMITVTPWPNSPREIIYAQISRVLASHARGVETAEDMAGLLALIEPWKDANWYDDLKGLKAGDGDILWDTLEAVVRLLSRKNLWASAPRSVIEGKEFAEALG